VHKNLKLKFHPYKVKLVQEFNDDESNRCLEFCNLIMERINANFLFNIVVFPDEATFELNGQINRHSFRYWSDNNSYWMSERYTQYPQKLNVWAGVLNDVLIEPFFIDDDLTAEK